MAVTINSSTTSGAIITSDTTGITTIQANNVTSLTADGTGRLVLPSISLPTATAGDLGYNGTALYFTPAGTQRGVIPSQQMFVLNTGYTGTNGTVAQSIFGLSSGVTLASSTIYAFQATIYMAKTAGTNPHTLATSFGGSATLNSIYYTVNEMDTSGTVGSRAPLGGLAGASVTLANTASATVVTASMTVAAQIVSLNINGVISANAGGTLLPLYTLSAAPGGAYTTAAGSYMLIYPVATGSSNVSIGTWA